MENTLTLEQEQPAAVSSMRLLGGVAWRVECGDSLELMAAMKSASVDAVVTDPPYMIGAISTGDAKSKAGSWAVWDKEWIGPAGPAQLRPTYEMILFCGKGEAKIDNRSQADIFRLKWMARLGGSGHPAQKPVPLLKQIIELVTKPGDVVLDPFCGGGTTGIAAMQCGRRFEGYEGDPEYAALCKERIGNAHEPMRAFDTPPKEKLTA